MHSNINHDRLYQSKNLFDQANNYLPGGITRDVVNIEPFPVYVTKSDGAKCWDIDGNEYVDLVLGNGSILLGHNNNLVTRAICEQAPLGLHSGLCNPLEVSLSKKVCQLVPCAELVRFTMTGSEATHLAVRLARSYTGRDKYIRFTGHFHGWHDSLAIGSITGSSRPDSVGIPSGTYDLAHVCRPNSIEDITAINTNEISCIILEPSGGKAGLELFDIEFLQFLREYCDKHDIVLIFDEIVTGFRWSPGGAQSLLGVTPDLTTLGKVLGGGLPCAAVCGKRKLMRQLSFLDSPHETRVHHGGTFNGNPLAAASGLAALEQLEDGIAISQVNAYTNRLIEELSTIWQRLEVPGSVYGQASVFHCTFDHINSLRSHRNLQLTNHFQRLLLQNGILMRKTTGMLSCSHNEKDMKLILEAAEKSLITMKKNGLF